MASLTDQIEFANVILLNKTDMMPAATVDSIERVVKTLNPYVPPSSVKTDSSDQCPSDGSFRIGSGW